MVKVSDFKYERIVLKHEVVGRFTFEVYDADPYVSVEISEAGRIVEKAMINDCAGVDWEKLKARYENA